MKVFCFHSTRETIPTSGWAYPNIFDMFKEHLVVDPQWFHGFIDHAVHEWGSENLTITFDDGYGDVIETSIYSARQGIRTIVFVPTFHVGGFVQGVPMRVMGMRELSFLLMNGVEIGSHGNLHVDWKTREDEEVLADMWFSANILKNARNQAYLYKVESVPIAPPHGSFTLKHIELAKSCGFTEFYGTLDDNGSPEVIKRCLADQNGYVEDKGVGQITWPWYKNEEDTEDEFR